MTIGGRVVPVNGSPTSRLAWQKPETWPVWPQGGVGLTNVRIIHPFVDFVRQNCRIVEPGERIAVGIAEESGGVKVRRRVGLGGEREPCDAVITENTASVEIVGRRRPNGIVNEKDGKCAGIYKAM